MGHRWTGCEVFDRGSVETRDHEAHFSKCICRGSLIDWRVLFTVRKCLQLVCTSIISKNCSRVSEWCFWSCFLEIRIIVHLWNQHDNTNNNIFSAHSCSEPIPQLLIVSDSHHGSSRMPIIAMAQKSLYFANCNLRSHSCQSPSLRTLVVCPKPDSSVTSRQRQ